MYETAEDYFVLYIFSNHEVGILDRHPIVPYQDSLQSSGFNIAY
jgi:hypothetical protein